MQAAGLQTVYSDKELAICIRMIPSLAFAAPHEVPSLFAEVAAQLPTPEADTVIEYFERTYIGRTLPGGSYGFRDASDNECRGSVASQLQCYCGLPSSQYMEIYLSFEEGTGTCRSEAGKIYCWRSTN